MKPLYILVTLTILACNTEQKEKSKDINSISADNPIEITDSIETVKKVDSTINSTPEKPPLKSELLDGLFSIAKYRDIMSSDRRRACNSGGSNRESYDYKPNYPGFYYQYMYCIPENRKLSQEGGMTMKVYMKGKSVAGYMDSTQVLIHFLMSYPEAGMQKLNLVGQPIEKAIQLLGKNYSEKDDYIIYKKGNEVLIFYLHRNVIDAIRYARLKNSNVFPKEFEESERSYHRDARAYLR